MTVAHTHSCFAVASFPHGDWHAAEPLLQSWKSLLQSLPGFVECDVWIRRLPNDDIRSIIRVAFEYREQLEEFLKSRWAPERVIGSLDQKPYDVEIHHYEQHI